MQLKLAFIDFETGGLDKKTSPALSVSITIDIDGTTVAKYTSLICPYDPSLVTEKALEVNCLDIEQLMEAKSEKQVFGEMIAFLIQYVDMKDRSDRLFFVAHSAGFDDGIFRAMVHRNANDTRLRSKIFWGELLCTRVMAANYLCMVRHTMSSFTLGDICLKVFGDKEFNSIVGEGLLHEAETDVRLCRELFYEVRGGVNGLS